MLPYRWKADSADTLIKVYTRPAAGYGTRESSWLPVTAKTDLKELYSALTSKIESSVTLIENSQELSTFVQVPAPSTISLCQQCLACCATKNTYGKFQSNL